MKPPQTGQRDAPIGRIMRTPPVSEHLFLVPVSPSPKQWHFSGLKMSAYQSFDCIEVKYVPFIIPHPILMWWELTFLLKHQSKGRNQNCTLSTLSPSLSVNVTTDGSLNRLIVRLFRYSESFVVAKVWLSQQEWYLYGFMSHKRDRAKVTVSTVMKVTVQLMPSFTYPR